MLKEFIEQKTGEVKSWRDLKEAEINDPKKDDRERNRRRSREHSRSRSPPQHRPRRDFGYARPPVYDYPPPFYPPYPYDRPPFEQPYELHYSGSPRYDRESSVATTTATISGQLASTLFDSERGRSRRSDNY